MLMLPILLLLLLLLFSQSGVCSLSQEVQKSTREGMVKQAPRTKRPNSNPQYHLVMPCVGSFSLLHGSIMCLTNGQSLTPIAAASTIDDWVSTASRTSCGVKKNWILKCSNLVS